MNKAIPVREQFEDFKKNRKIYSAELLKFHGMDGLDCYNPSVPFELKGVTYIACRVEKRSEEFSVIRFFRKEEDGWYPVDTPILPLQDPAVYKINGEYIMSGINVTWSDNITTFTTWKTDFYRINDLTHFDYLFSGPEHMKDIRIVELPNKKIAVFGRPQGEEVYRKYNAIARITFTIADRLEDITPEAIDSARVLEGQFNDDEWGGANQAVILEDGNIGVIGHKSYRTIDDEGKQQLHYYGIAFRINPETLELTREKVIISSDCFPSHPPKRPDLVDVTFTSGIIRDGKGKAEIYTGVSDSVVGHAVIDDPFILN